VAASVRLQGIHHVTLITRDMAAMTRFLTEVVGVHLVKTTVNFDASEQKHFYFGDEKGQPGTVITYFEIPDLPENRLGAGGMHHLAFCVEDESDLSAQMERLEGMGIAHSGVLDRTYFKSLYLKGPEGLTVEFATAGPGFQADGDQVEGKIVHGRSGR
jgi:glyoxalase family protein